MRSIISKIQTLLLKRTNKQKNDSVNNESVITITFDDAYESVYLNAYSSMKERGFKGVIFVIVGLIGEYFAGHKIMNIKQLNEIYNNGWEIGNHTFSHPYSLKSITYTSEQYEAEITFSKSKLEKMGFDIISFAYPHGIYSDKLMIEEVKKSYRYARTTKKGLNEIYRNNLFLKGVTFKNAKFTDVKSWIDRVKNEGGWLIITCHGIISDHVPLPDPVYGWAHKAEFDKLLNYIEENKIRVATFQDIKILSDE